MVVGVTALHLHGIDIGPATPLYLVSTSPHPVRRPGLKVARVSALPPHRGSVAVAEHAFASAATQLNLLDLVAARDWLLRSNRCRLPALRAYALGFTGRGASRRVVPPDLFAPGWTRRERPCCGSAWCLLGCQCRNAIWS